MASFKQLQAFGSDELLLAHDEALAVLRFIFEPADHEVIDSLPRSEFIRSFAQGLLVEAIDASYAMGHVEALLRSLARPSGGVLAIIKRFGHNAARHWFKHATSSDLLDARIYEVVRRELARRFRSELRLMLTSDYRPSLSPTLLSYQTLVDGCWLRWG